MKTTMQGIITKYTIGEPTPGQSTVEKILMMIGVIGAGKSTVINAMVNYIFGVNWEDDFRFKIVKDDSMLDQIKAYTIYPEKESPVDFTLTIIDIPEFQDISCTEQNNLITQQIQRLFKDSNDISCLNGIGIVTSANLPRSDPVKTYIFHSILSIFGKDLASNIFMMVTSANNCHPPVITAITEAGIPFAEFYEFENSILYTRNTDNEVETGWNINFSSFQKFFPVLNDMQSVSLDLTKNVQQKYEELQLKVAIDRLNTLVDSGVSKLKELNETKDTHQKYENDIANCKEYTYQIKVTETTKVYHQSSQCVTVCIRCNYTCHDSCGYTDDSEKYNCGSMNGRGRSSAYCVKCPGNCFWEYHRNLPYHYEEHEVTKTMTNDVLKAKYYAAQEGKTKTERAIEDITQCLEKIEADVISIVNEVQEKLLYLDGIVLLPNSLIVREHLLQLIKIETNQQHLLFYKQQEAILKAKDGVDCLRGSVQNENDSDPKDLWYTKLTFKKLL